MNVNGINKASLVSFTEQTTRKIKKKIENFQNRNKLIQRSRTHHMRSFIAKDEPCPIKKKVRNF